jgi:D-alanyl-D-alanine carboxypeptidase
VKRALPIPRDYARRRGLVRQREARTLVSIGRSPEGRLLRLTQAAAGAWASMVAEAKSDEIRLVAVSGFRSIARQEALLRRKLGSGEPIGSTLRTLAAPGYSEHHTGRAIDIGTPGHLDLTEAFAGTPAYRWLRRHAGRFGFRLSYPRGNALGFCYEPWHWCYLRDLASKSSRR